MKVYLPWLEQYFEKPLAGKAEKIADALTFHSFEVEEIAGEKEKEVLDINVLADRAADCLSHRGIAKEIRTVLSLTMKRDPLTETLPEYAPTESLKLTIDTAKCNRHMGALVRGVKVGPSPAWLKEYLEALGQRSINNIVDATNYVMLDIGQPLHAFDAGKISWHGDVLEIGVRETKGSEEVETLTGQTYTLPEGTAVICEGTSGKALDIAGIKGGMASAITSDTKDLFVSVANFDGTAVRKTAQTLKLFTDASTRFQNRPSPELVPYGMRDVLALIKDIAGGEVVAVVDTVAAGFPMAKLSPVSVSLAQINAVLGSALESDQVTGILDRLGFSFIETEGTFIVTPPFERNDLTLPENVIEEIGRIKGYDTLPAKMLPPLAISVDQDRYRGTERIKDFLVERGFTELSTPSFAVEGEIMLANPLDQTRPALRASLIPNMEEALIRNAPFAPRFMGPVTSLMLFEVGTLFTKQGETLALSLGYRALSGTVAADTLKEYVAALEQELFGAYISPRYSLDGMAVEIPLAGELLEKLGKDYTPVAHALGMFVPFSTYPFALRDIAVWTPEGTTEEMVENIIREVAGALLVRIDLFDQFEKTDKETGIKRTSYAFRLVFESAERTLTDGDLDPLMQKVTETLNAQGEGWQVR